MHYLLLMQTLANEISNGSKNGVLQTNRVRNAPVVFAREYSLNGLQVNISTFLLNNSVKPIQYNSNKTW